MHTKLRLMALGVVLLGGGTSVAQAEEGPECQPLMIFGWNNSCPAYATWWDICEAARPNCGPPTQVYCWDGGEPWEHWEIGCGWT